jgi:MATE family multidrug resistance protein
MLTEILKLSFPIVVGQLAFALMSFIDTLLMGQLGVAALAGGGLGSVVYQFFYIVGIGALVATANLIAYAKGSEDDAQIHRAVLSGSVLVIILFVMFSFIIWNCRALLIEFGQAAETVDYAERYLQSVVWALLPALAFILLRSLIVGLGRPALILPISLFAAALNYPLSYILMKGLFGLPEMGVEGIALGTCIISWGMFLGLAYLIYRQPVFRAFPFWVGWHNFSLKQFLETLKLGVPIALAHAMEVGMFSAAALLVGLLGVNALAAHQVALQCTTLSFMVPLGISQAVSVKVGELYGSQNISRVKDALKAGFALAAVGAVVAVGFFWLVPELLISVFLPNNGVSSFEYSEVVLVASQVLFVAALFQLVDGWQVILMGALRGFKLGLSPTLASIFSYWLVGIPCAYLFLSYWGAAGVWIGMGLGLTVSAMTLALLLYRELKRH